LSESVGAVRHFSNWQARPAFRDVSFVKRVVSYVATFQEMKLILLLCLACIVAPPVTGSVTALLVQSGSPNCEGEFRLTDYAFACAGDECLLGSVVQISGTCKYTYLIKVNLWSSLTRHGPYSVF
jgi:hypothetical protein